MARKQQGIIDDSLQEINITDFSGGLNTQDGALTLASNQSPQLQNCIGFPGKLVYCGGFVRSSTLPTGTPDATHLFYDASNARHIMVWLNGNLYDTVSGASVLVKSGAYTTGQQIGHTDQGGILYYCTATVALRQYNGTTESAVPNSGSTGTVPPPMGTYLCSYAGSLVCANPNVGTGVQAGAFIYSNVNDPTAWIGANINQLGSSNVISFIIPMGVSSAGVPPTGSFLVGTSRLMFLYQGAINALTQKIVNCPVGALDPNSAIYVPSSDLFGSVVFLGTDDQFWSTNGITAGCISLKILNFIFAIIQVNRGINPAQRFFASYNERYQYYFCDLGQNQLIVYRWQTNAWYYIQGWPSGSYVAGFDANGYPTNYVANTSGSLSPGVYQVGLDSTTFGGTNPSVFYVTPFLHGNDPEEEKEWQWVALETLNNYNAYSVQGQPLPQPGSLNINTNTLIFNNPNALAASGVGIWDTSLWDECIWSQTASPFGSAPTLLHGMPTVTAPASTWVPRPTNQPFRTSAASWTISWASTATGAGTPAMDVIGFRCRVNMRGKKTVGGQQYSTQSGVIASGNDPYS